MTRSGAMRYAYVILLIALIVGGTALTSGVMAAPETSLRGPNVIRRSEPSAMARTTNSSRLQTEIIQGEKKGENICTYSLEYSESMRDPQAKRVWMAAVDPTTCQFEFEISTFDPIQNTPSPDVDVVTAEAKGRPERDKNRRDFANPEVIASILIEEPNAAIALARRDQKLTVVGRWEDLVSIDVNKVLVAVRADTEGNDIVDADCKYAWAWRNVTGWNHPGGDWTDCRNSNTRATALADGHFRNSAFPTCYPGTVHVYYDRLWAKVAPKNNLDHGHYDWGIRGTWAEGEDCSEMLHWASFEVIKGEYSTSWIN